MNVKVYQIDRDRDKDHLIFQDSKAFEKVHGDRIPAEIYKKVFDGSLDVTEPEEVYEMCSISAPSGYTGHSLSVSDVVEFVDSGEFYFCDTIGFKKVRFVWSIDKALERAES